MDSLDAQCLIVQLLEGEIRPPDLWRHDASGGLSCAYENGERTFTWSPADVADMGRRWRESDVGEPPERARPFVELHERLEALTVEAGLGPADVTIHDVARAEVRAVWEDAKLVVIVDEVGRPYHA